MNKGIIYMYIAKSIKLETRFWVPLFRNERKKKLATDLSRARYATMHFLALSRKSLNSRYY